MARNATWDFLNEQKSDRQHHQKIVIAEGYLDRFEQADEHISEREYEAEAAKAISLLPQRRKEIFLLSTREDRSLDEIAQKLGLSKAVVKKTTLPRYPFFKEIHNGFAHETGLYFIFVNFFLRKPSPFFNYSRQYNRNYHEYTRNFTKNCVR